LFNIFVIKVKQILMFFQNRINLKFTHLMKAKFLLLVVGLVIFLGTSFLNAQTERNSKVSAVPDTLDYRAAETNLVLEFSFHKGESFNHPTFAIWLEDLDGNYIESLFVTKYIATGIFGNADAGDGSWSDKPGESIRPAALPYWGHKRGVVSRDSLYVPTPENPVTDAITGATPTKDFIMYLPVESTLPEHFNLMFEINQSWDWNEYWTNGKFPGNLNYQSSSQPSVVYQTNLELTNIGRPAQMKAIGHGHYSGKDGSLTTDLNTLTTALDIASDVKVTILNK